MLKKEEDDMNSECEQRKSKQKEGEIIFVYKNGNVHVNCENLINQIHH